MYRPQVVQFTKWKGRAFYYALCLPSCHTMYRSRLHVCRYGITSRQYVDSHLHVDMLVPFLDRHATIGIVLYVLMAVRLASNAIEHGCQD
jgi:hypothetical protein